VWLCGYSGRDDTLPTASETTTTCDGGRAVLQETLDNALAVVKAAGYRVSKPKTPKRKSHTLRISSGVCGFMARSEFDIRRLDCAP
jgi:hypothetical protein